MTAAAAQPGARSSGQPAVVIGPVRTRRADHRLVLLASLRQRMAWLMLAACLGFSVLILRLGYIGVTEYGGAGGAGSRAALAELPPRADIVDRNGVPLARSMEAYAIRVNPAKLINPPGALADQLATIFPDIPRSTLLAKLTGPRSTYLVRRALPEQVAAVNAIGDVGFGWPREPDRLYPQMRLAAHVLGFTNSDGRGVMGIEAALNDRLTDPARVGEPVALSLDIRVQAALESELASAMTNLEALGAAGVMLDVDTGEVLAMASLPTFNPNKLADADLQARRNAVTQNVYELGSTFKPLAVAAALDAGTVTSMARRYDATEPLAIAGFQIRDSHPQRRWLNVPEMLIHSSNIVTARIVDDLGADRMKAMFERLDYGRRPIIEVPETSRTLWPANWGRLTTMTTGYGHGIAVTPLHLANGYAALVNGGISRPATVLKLGDKPPPRGVRVFKPATSARMRQLLRLIVSDGTGRNADAPGFRVGGKTGSADKPRGGGYDTNSVVATFAAAFPMDRPRYVLLVMIDEPRGNAFSSGQRTAGWTAAPVARNIIARTGPMLGVFPDEGRDVDVSELTPLLWRNQGGAE